MLRSYPREKLLFKKEVLADIHVFLKEFLPKGWVYSLKAGRSPFCTVIQFTIKKAPLPLSEIFTSQSFCLKDDYNPYGSIYRQVRPLDSFISDRLPESCTKEWLLYFLDTLRNILQHKDFFTISFINIGSVDKPFIYVKKGG